MEIFKIFGSIFIKNDEANKAIADTSDNARKSSDVMKNSFAEVGRSVEDTTSKIGRTTGEMAIAMREVYAEQRQKMRAFRDDQLAIKYQYFEMAQSSKNYSGTNKEFMDDVEALGKKHKKITDEMLKNDDMAKLSVLKSVGTILARSTQSEKIAQVYDSMNNPLYKVNDGLLKITGAMEKMAKKGTPAALALKQLGPNANMKDLQDRMGVINQGLMRFPMVALVAAVGAGMFYGALHEGAMENEKYADSFNNMVDKLKEAFKPVMDVFIEVMPYIYNFISAIAEVVIQFNEAHPVLAKIIGGFLLLIPALVLLLSPLAIGVGLIGGMQAAFSSVMMLIGPLVTGLGAMMGTVLLVAGAIVAVIAVGVLLYKNWDEIKAYAIKIWDAIKEFFSKTMDGIKSVMTKVWDAIKSATEAVWNGIKLYFETLFNIWKAVFEIAFNAIKVIVEVVWGLISQITKVAWDLLKTYFEILFGIWKGIFTIAFEGLKKVVEVVWDAIKKVTSTVWDAFKPYFEAVFNFLKNAFTTAFDAIKKVVQVVWDAIEKATKFVWDALKSYFETIFNVLKTIFTTVWDAIKKVVTTVWDLIKTGTEIVWNAIKSYLETVVNAIKSVITTVWEGIKSVTTTVFNAIKDTLSSIWNGIKSTVGTVVDGIQSKINSVWDSIKSTTKSVFDTIKGYITKPVEDAKDAVGKAIDGIKGFFTNLNLPEIKIPKIKLPHFSLSGKFDLTPPNVSVPKLNVDWYKTGGIATADSIVGIGEAGNEAVLPLEGQYLKPWAQEMSKQLIAQGGSNKGTSEQTIYIQLDGKTIAQETIKNMPQIIRAKTGIKN